MYTRYSNYSKEEKERILGDLMESGMTMNAFFQAPRKALKIRTRYMDGKSKSW